MPQPSAYQRIASELRARILDGTHPPDSRMPSLREVEDLYGVSRYIARAAYQVLISEGRVEGRFGGGYYVRSYRPVFRAAMQRLTAEAREAGNSIWAADPGTTDRSITVDDIQVTRETPPGDVAADLGLEDDVSVVVRRGRYLLDGRPVLVSTRHYPVDLAAGTQLEHVDTGPGGAYQRLTELGHEPGWFQEAVTARMPTPDETEQLNLPAGTPVLAIRRIAWSHAERALEVNEMVADSSAYVLLYKWPARWTTT